jgi:hypothetical protein
MGGHTLELPRKPAEPARSDFHSNDDVAGVSNQIKLKRENLFPQFDASVDSDYARRHSAKVFRSARAAVPLRKVSIVS